MLIPTSFIGTFSRVGSNFFYSLSDFCSSTTCVGLSAISVAAGVYSGDCAGPKDIDLVSCSTGFSTGSAILAQGDLCCSSVKGPATGVTGT